MRPPAIIWFQRLSLATAELEIVQTWLGWDRLRLLGQSIAAILTAQIFAVAVMVALTLLVSLRRSKVAMWLLVVLFALSLPRTFILLREGRLFGSHLITAVQIIAELVAVALLFTRPARRWMSRESAIDLGEVFA